MNVFSSVTVEQPSLLWYGLWNILRNGVLVFMIIGSLYVYLMCLYMTVESGLGVSMMYHTHEKKIKPATTPMGVTIHRSGRVGDFKWMYGTGAWFSGVFVMVEENVKAQYYFKCQVSLFFSWLRLFRLCVHQVLIFKVLQSVSPADLQLDCKVQRKQWKQAACLHLFLMGLSIELQYLYPPLQLVPCFWGLNK